VGFKSFRLELEAHRDVPPPAFATAIPQLFEALLDVFAPLDVTYAIDGGDFVRVTRLDPVRAFANEPLWCDEELTRDALTRCKPGLGTDVVTELYDRFAGIAPQSFYISAEGALRHHAPGTDEPAWYGRWRSTHLHELCTVSFHWTADPWRGFELRCPLSGYPFTSVRPLVRGSLADGDPAIAAENRALLFPALAKVRGALGFDPHEVEWGHDAADYGPLFPDDRRDIAKRWLPLLAASLVLLFACKKPASPPAPVVAIDVSWPGASAEVLEHAVVDPIEQAVAPFGRSIESRIAADHATVAVEVEDLDRALANIQQAIPLPRLPRDIPPPVIRKTYKDDAPVLWLAVRGKLSAVELSQVVRDEVVPELQRVVGVAQIDVRGLSKRVTVVRPDLVKLDATGLVLFDLITALQSRAIDVPGGRITGTQTLRVDDAPHDPTSIGDLVIREVNGAPVRLRDVAVVEETVERAGADEPMLGIHAYDPTHAREVVDRVMAAIGKAPPSVTIVESKSPLPPRRKPQLVVQLRGPDLNALATAADAIAARLAAKGIRDVARDPAPAEAEERVVVDRDRADALDVAIPQVHATLDALRGTPVGPTGMRFAEKLPDLVARLRVRSRDGVLVPLSDMASVKAGETGVILHRDREPTIELAIHASGAREIVKSYKPPDGVRVMLSP
jgi:hypothetical protein